MSAPVYTTFSLPLPSTLPLSAGGQQDLLFVANGNRSWVVEPKIELTYIKLGAAYYGTCIARPI